MIAKRKKQKKEISLKPYEDFLEQADNLPKRSKKRLDLIRKFYKQQAEDSEEIKLRAASLSFLFCAYLNKNLSGFEEQYNKVLKFFKNDHLKTQLWFSTENPFFGNISALKLITLRGDAGLKTLSHFIEDAEKGWK